MKILVFAHRFDVGGSQMNAIDFAVALRDFHGHDVSIFATPGSMVKVAEAKGLRFLPAPISGVHPSLAMIRALDEVVRCERPDLIHVWDWWQCLDAYYGVHLVRRIPMLVSDMQSDVIHRAMPKSLPFTFGTPEFVDIAKAAGRRHARLLLPPVDVHRNAPDAVDPEPFRKQYGIKSSDLTLVTVSRLAWPMKFESLRRTIDAVRTLGRELPLRFAIVGDGEAHAELKRMADETNTDLGRDAVVLTGELLDPRPAYAAADIVVGMGGSALRAMAFGKPVIVVGIQGFSAPLTPETSGAFYYKGIYGKGDGDPGNACLLANIRALAGSADRLSELGEFSRQFVVRNFALDKLCAELSAFCCAAADEGSRFHIDVVDGVRTAAILYGARFVPDGLRRLVRAREMEKARVKEPILS